MKYQKGRAMHEEMLEFAKPGEEPALRERYQLNNPPWQPSDYRLFLIGLTTRCPIQGEKKYPLTEKTAAEQRLKVLHDAWEQAQLKMQIQTKKNPSTKKKT